MTSVRERAIILLVCGGMNNREIGESLGLAVKSVRNYLSKIYKSLGVTNRVGLVAQELSFVRKKTA